MSTREFRPHIQCRTLKSSPGKKKHFSGRQSSTRYKHFVCFLRTRKNAIHKYLSFFLTVELRWVASNWLMTQAFKLILNVKLCKNYDRYSLNNSAKFPATLLTRRSFHYERDTSTERDCLGKALICRNIHVISFINKPAQSYQSQWFFDLYNFKRLLMHSRVQLMEII